VTAERNSFYTRTIGSLLDRWVIDRTMSVLVVGGGPGDRDVFRTLGFEDVTITNVDGDSAEVEPYRFERQDAEALTYKEGAFDWAVVSAALHHCRSPHRALLELYRVASRGLLALEARDSALMRAAIRLHLADEYELTAVTDHGFRSGGVRNTAVPNYVYRWTEREVEKTISSAAPHARHEFVWFHELELPLSIFEVGGRRRVGHALRLLQPAARAVAKIAPGQANLFAFAVVKTDELQPWLRPGEEGPAPDEAEIRRRLGS
jgi:SAM-dependent methyltransferase